jgi:hypothetical protein
MAKIKGYSSVLTLIDQFTTFGEKEEKEMKEKKQQDEKTEEEKEKEDSGPIYCLRNYIGMWISLCLLFQIPQIRYPFPSDLVLHLLYAPTLLKTILLSLSRYHLLCPEDMTHLPLSLPLGSINSLSLLIDHFISTHCQCLPSQKSATLLTPRASSDCVPQVCVFFQDELFKTCLNTLTVLLQV